MAERKRRAGSRSRTAAPETKVDSRTRRRARPTPAWLMEPGDLDEMARRRCLLVLSVLSGETPVTDAIEEAKISRGTYYQLESRALRAMLAALSPGSADDGASLSHSAKIAELEKKVARLEQEKRRAERLLLVTRQVIKPGALTTGAGRPPKSRTRPRSKTTGSRPSIASTKPAVTSPTTAPAGAAPPSIPTTAGGAAP